MDCVDGISLRCYSGVFLNNLSSKKPQRGLLDRWFLPGGIEPDPRFTLANERTFLAWIRTSFALIAGSIALKSELFDNSGAFVTLGSVALGAGGGNCKRTFTLQVATS